MGQDGGLCKAHPNLGEVWIQALMARARRASAGALGVIYWRALQVARVLALPVKLHYRHCLYFPISDFLCALPASTARASFRCLATRRSA